MSIKPARLVRPLASFILLSKMSRFAGSILLSTTHISGTFIRLGSLK